MTKVTHEQLRGSDFSSIGYEMVFMFGDLGAKMGNVARDFHSSFDVVARYDQVSGFYTV